MKDILFLHPILIPFLLVLQGASQNAAELPRPEMLVVERFRGLMSHPADSSLILKPLSLLSKVYDEQSPDVSSSEADQVEVISSTRSSVCPFCLCMQHRDTPPSAAAGCTSSGSLYT